MKHVCTVHTPNEKDDDVSMCRQEGSKIRQLANAHSVTGPAGIMGKSTFFRGTISKVSSTQRVQNLLKIVLSLMVFETDDILISAKIQDGSAEIWENQYLLRALHLRFILLLETIPHD